MKEKFSTGTFALPVLSGHTVMWRNVLKFYLKL